MRKIIKEKLKPASSKKENTILLLVVVLIITTAFLLIKLQQNKEYKQNINDNEISSYIELTNIESGIYADLLNFKTELEIIYSDEKLPTINELEENFIQPFVKDIAWEERGKLFWELFEKDNRSYYLGISENVDLVGNFLVEIDEKNEIKIYFSKDIENNYKLSEHEIHSHWKEIVAYTGEDEREKFRGKEK